MAKKQTYTESFEELNRILAELENMNAEINMEMIEEKVKRAAFLVDKCKKQLHEMDKELEKLLENFE